MGSIILLHIVLGAQSLMLIQMQTPISEPAGVVLLIVGAISLLCRWYNGHWGA